MRALRQFAFQFVFIVAGIVAMSSAASAYYHWVFFPTSAAPFTAVPGKFDLAAQKDNKVNFFISSQGPATLMPGDSSTAIYSQNQHAAAIWNNVSTSS